MLKNSEFVFSAHSHHLCTASSSSNISSLLPLRVALCSPIFNVWLVFLVSGTLGNRSNMVTKGSIWLLPDFSESLERGDPPHPSHLSSFWRVEPFAFFLKTFTKSKMNLQKIISGTVICRGGSKWQASLYHCSKTNHTDFLDPITNDNYAWTISRDVTSSEL